MTILLNRVKFCKFVITTTIWYFLFEGICIVSTNEVIDLCCSFFPIYAYFSRSSNYFQLQHRDNRFFLSSSFHNIFRSTTIDLAGSHWWITSKRIFPLLLLSLAFSNLISSQSSYLEELLNIHQRIPVIILRSFNG